MIGDIHINVRGKPLLSEMASLIVKSTTPNILKLEIKNAKQNMRQIIARSVAFISGLLSTGIAQNAELKG